MREGQTFKRTPRGIRKGVELFRVLLIPAEGREDGVRELYKGECFNISPLPKIASQAKQAKCLTLCKRSFECSHALTIASYTPHTCAWFNDPLYVFNTHTQSFSHI